MIARKIPKHSDERDSTALLTAVSENNLEMALMLIAAGADLNIRDNWGNTALILAARYNFLEMALMLINAGAITHAENDNHVCAYWMAKHEYNLRIALALTIDMRNRNAIKTVHSLTNDPSSFFFKMPPPIVDIIDPWVTHLFLNDPELNQRLERPYF